MNDQKQQVAERVKEANNILVTVSANPSVDQLAACIGLTLTLNKMGKHATAVFSGEVPSTIKFLQPEKTIEKNTDSLRDFIIALDKSKADKLRYKVEDKVVKIFITPYRTSISEKDLEFSQGDFNVDVVLALGVHNQADLDQAITAHGRILHDATVVTVNNKPGGEIGSINWLDPMSSSLSELAVMLVDMLDKSLLDGQIATAMLTGIVAETERFSNSKTSPRTMTISAELMTAGANQQLVATKLEAPAPPPPPVVPVRPIAEVPQEVAAAKAAKANDGTLEIAHNDKRDIPVPAPAFEDPKLAVAEPSLVSTPVSAQKPDAPTPSQKPMTDPEPEHQPELQAEPIADDPKPEPEPEYVPAPPPPQINIDEHGALSLPGVSNDIDDIGSLPPLEKRVPPSISHHAEAPKMILDPPALGGQLTANTKSDDTYDTSADPLAGGLPSMDVPDGPQVHASQAHESAPIGTTIKPPVGQQSEELAVPPLTPDYMLPSSDPYAAQQPSVSSPEPSDFHDDETLSEIEQDVHSSHVAPHATGADLPLTSASTPAPAVIPAAPYNPTPQPVYPPYDPVAPQAPVVAYTPPTDPVSPLTPAADEPYSGAADLQDAREAVERAMNAANSDGPLPPVEALNAQPIDLPPLNNPAPAYEGPVPNMPTPAPAPNGVPVWDPASGAPAPLQPLQPSYNDANPMAAQAMPGVPGMMPTPYDPTAPQQQVQDPNAPPPVPPPMMPPSFQ